MNVKVIADSTCDLPKEIINNYDIDIVPLYVILDDKSYKDSIEITVDELISWSDETKQSPKTSAPSVDDFLTAFKPYVDKGQDIVFVCLSSELSATCQNANLAADMTEGINVKVIDGRNVSVGTGIVVYKAAMLAKDGLSVDEIEAKLEEFIPKVFTGFVLDKLEFLRRGGRCSTLQAFAATSLKLRPELIVKDGKIISGSKLRGSMEKVVKSYFSKKTANLDEIDPEFAFVVKTRDDMNLSPKSYDIVEKTNHFKEVIKSNAGCVITAHSGPNTYGLFYVKK